MGALLLIIVFCAAVVLFVAAFWVVLDRSPEHLTGLRTALHHAARWIVFLVAALMLTWSVAMVWEAGVMVRDDMLRDKPDDYLLVHVVGLGMLAGMAWIMIIGALLRPDVKWLFRWLAARIRPS